jgi:hypothetical protein
MCGDFCLLRESFRWSLLCSLIMFSLVFRIFKKCQLYMEWAVFCAYERIYLQGSSGTSVFIEKSGGYSHEGLWIWYTMLSASCYQLGCLRNDLRLIAWFQTCTRVQMKSHCASKIEMSAIRFNVYSRRLRLTGMNALVRALD